MRVGIVGAGPSGLTAIKTCLDYGLQPICFEMSSGIGGLWNYSNEVVEGRGTVMKSTIINTSKEMTAYSDFPPRKQLPNFMHNSELLQYLHDYAKKFNLDNYIHLNTEVLRVSKTKEYEETGQWVIEAINTETMTTYTEIVQAVFLCSGHHANPLIPEFRGLNTAYKGHVSHSHSYKTPKPYENQSVLVVGIGNSAIDMATELSRHASKVFLSTRQGAWILSRTFHCGYPYDILLLNRFCVHLHKCLPTMASKYMEYYLNYRFDHAMYGLRPEWGVFQAHPTLSDDLPSRISSGMVVIKPNICEFGDFTATFTDGSKEQIDAVLLCTGYRISFPYIKEDLKVNEDNEIVLYKNMYSPNLSHPRTLVVIGLVQPWGSIMPISEMQCRLACEALVGDVQLPSALDMERDIRLNRQKMKQRYVRSPRHTIQVDYISYMDDLARMIGAKPNPWSYLFTDPKFAIHLYFGPCVPYQYRLRGPHSWHKARNVIMDTWERVRYPYKTRRVEPKRRINFSITNLHITLLFIFLITVVSQIWVLLLVTIW